MAICLQCAQIEQCKRYAAGHHALRKTDEKNEDWSQLPAHTSHYVCSQCGTRWEHSSDRDNPQAGWRSLDTDVGMNPPNTVRPV